ncbi:alpha/beta fold hydrolase [Vibrio coralliilyticus]|uniref:alpha/beta fold hydrolase n=1 Tax=Vibrio coralliilyticus TaxID=190893 RepID=UPI0015618880|nr:alpha/beta fold hydrolase [Vibrio coralliilyticus]MCC2525607.1 alpha/beta fold hydrolase [Vibrio coralliilyticus]NRF32903.1 alpha/beta fold hydrolase [Vibrio coralliilyticus]NRF55357.1 alpha/beta fold hydrolase [Vibrio coralliilyticus]NRG04317.1 alpha/beta fold hydrolase [Vibrio coralliilyticus]
MNESSTSINPPYTQESNFEQAINNNIAQLWRSREEGFFKSFDKTRLFWVKLTSPEHTKAIVVVNGRIECTWKYQELFYDLFQQGYDIYSFDHRGQGLSDRLIEDQQMGYVEDFEDYVQDLHGLIQHFDLSGYDKRYLLGHSMGGNIATRYLQSYPDHSFSAVSLSAPMFGVNLPWHLKPIAIPLGQIMTALAPKPTFAPGQAPYYPKPFEGNFLTQSHIRYHWFRDLYEQRPELKIGGASTRWVWQGLMAARKCHLMTRQIKVPLLLLQASSDQIVSNQDQLKFIKKLAKTNYQCALKIIYSSRHEVLFEKDEYRDQALDATLSFFNQY